MGDNMINRRQEVMQVAKKLFLEKGFTETSVQDILKQANISKGTFYNYFSSKNECLIAILENAQKEANVARERILLEADNDSKEVLAKQIIIRMEMNRKRNLIPLLSFVFQTKDENLRAYAKKQHITELAWLSSRFIDLYGDEVKQVAIDCAVILFGMIQQYHTIWNMYAGREIDRKRLMAFALRRIDAILPDLIERNESFVNDELFQAVNQKLRQEQCEKDEIMKMLKSAEEEWKDDERAQQYLLFFSEELSKKKPRIYLVESMTKAFYNDWKHSEKMLKAREITERLFAYVRSLAK